MALKNEKRPVEHSSKYYRKNGICEELGAGEFAGWGSYCTFAVKVLPLNYSVCRLMYAAIVQIHDWSFCETPNTVVTAGCMLAMPSF
jgi:hypothetical protein